MKANIAVSAFKFTEVLDRCIKSIEVGTKSDLWQGIITYTEGDADVIKYLDDNTSHLKDKWIWRNIGAPKGHNYAVDVGVEMSFEVSPDAEYISFMDHDVAVSMGWLEKIIAIFEANPKLGIMCPLSYPRWDITTCTMRGYPEQFRNVESINKDEMLAYMSTREPEWYELPIASQEIINKIGVGWNVPALAIWCFPWEFCWVMRRQCYDEVGLYGKNPPSTNEQAIVRNARAKGWKVGVANRVHAWHCDIGCDPMNPGNGPGFKFFGRRMEKAFEG